MRLTDLGWNDFWNAQFSGEDQECVPARVTEELRGFFRVTAEGGMYLAQVTGKVRYLAEGRADFPAVGDWVAIEPRPEESRARIAAILPRRTILLRKAAGRAIDEQILATNLDTVFIVASLNSELNLRRIERYLALVWESGARPVILLNKADLSSDPAPVIAEVERVAPGAAAHSLSAATGAGIENVWQYLGSGQTAAFIGSSGVGKSTIINALDVEAAQRVQPVREGDDRGKHTTASRQLFLLPGGGVVVDTPGLREIQLWESENGLARAFEEIDALTEQCKFRDCQHRGEPGCAVEQAVANGTLARKRLENYRKLQAELRYLERKVNLEACQAEKQRVKRIHKQVKHIYKKRSGRVPE